MNNLEAQKLRNIEI